MENDIIPDNKSPYECYWSRRALDAEKRLYLAIKTLERIQDPIGALYSDTTNVVIEHKIINQLAKDPEWYRNEAKLALKALYAL